MGKIYSYPIEVFKYKSIDIEFRAGYKREDLIPRVDPNYKYSFPDVDVKKDRVYLFDFYLDEKTKYIMIALKDYSIEEYLTKIKDKDDTVLGILNQPYYRAIKSNSK